MSSIGDSPSPSLLQSLKRFRFKKKNVLIDTDEESHNSDCNTLANGKITTDDHDHQEKDRSSEDEKEIVIIRKKKRLKVEDSEEIITQKNAKQDNSDSDNSNSVNYDKFKRLKFQSRSNVSFSNCDKSKSEEDLKTSGKEKSKVQKDIKSFFSDNRKKCDESASNGCQQSSGSSSSHSKLKDPTSIEDNEGNQNSCQSSALCSNNRSKKNRKNKEKKRKNSGTDNESDDGFYVEGKVYDSDASDDEICDDLIGMKGKVFEFLNTAPEEELKEIRCSQKKINSIIDARPFSGWRHLVFSCEDNRSIGTDVLNATQNLLTSRKVLSDLMHRCERVARKTERAIARGATNITKEPSILTSGFHLKSYQMVGLNWLAVMHSRKLSGILADEMGLGKTIQVIAFLAYLKENRFVTDNTPHLIIVPSSTLDNWCNELERWCPSLKVAKYYGSQEERRQLRFNWIKYGFDGIEVILSTYHVVSGVYEDKKMFRVVNLHYAIFDEGHMLKNMNTQRYENLFKINSKHKLLLTGTPIQNSLLELMSLLMFVMPDMFESKKEFIKYLFERKTKFSVQDQVKFERENIENAKTIMKPFMLRRLKVDVLQDLPAKTTEIIECPMVESQAAKYAELMKQFKISSSDESTKPSFLAMFTDLRRLANHPLTLRYIYENDKLSEIAKLLSGDFNYKENNVDKIFEDLLYMNDHDIHKLTLTFKCLKKFSLPDSVFTESGKFAKLDELLPELKANNHRLLIFSQFIFILDILEEYMRIREHSFVRIDGSTPVFERQQLIDLYNMDTQIFVFLLTTKAGGMGINLTSADTVIINDVDFNPYNDKQAEDRCHRMGQTRDVKIIRFISKGTIEEYIFKVAQEKTTLGCELTAEDEAEERTNMVSLLHSALGL